MVDFCSSMCISLRLDTLSIASVFARVFHMTVDQYEPMSNCTLAITNQKGPSEMHRHTRGLRLVLAVAAAVQPTLRNVHVTLLLLRHTDLRGSMLCKTTLPDAHWPHVEQRRRCNRAQHNTRASNLCNSNPETTIVTIMSNYVTTEAIIIQRNEKLL